MTYTFDKFALRELINHEFEQIGFTSDKHGFLRIPSIRVQINHALLERAKSNGIVKVFQEPVDSVFGTVTHNLKSLLGGLGSHERGASNVDLFFNVVSDINPNDLTVLHVGNRNLNEILASVGFGVPPEHSIGLDLISYFPSVILGDMHRFPFGEHTFDLIFFNWVLAYSCDPLSVIKSALSSLKDGGYIVIGWDNTSIVYEPGEGDLITKQLPFVDTSESLLSYFDQINAKYRVVFRREPYYPFDQFGRQVVIILRVGGMHLESRVRIEATESRSVSTLRSQLAGNSDPSIDARLEAHILSPRIQPKNKLPYLYMRQHYIRYGTSVDDLISRSIGVSFPPIIKSNVAMFPRSIFHGSDDALVEESVTSLNENGLYVLKEKIPLKIIDALRSSIQYPPSSTARQEADESELLGNALIRSIWLDTFFLRVAESYFNSMPILDFVYASRSSMFSNENQNSRSHDAQLWHFDKDRIKFLKVFVYLTDVEEENGPHEFLLGSHRNPPNVDGRLSDEFVQSKYAGFRVHRILGEAGTVFIEDTQGLHRGTPVSGGPRELLQLEYCNSLFGEEVPRFQLRDFVLQFPRLVSNFPRLFHRFLP